MSDVVDAFVKFYDGFEQDGVGKDGMPLFKSALMIRLSKPPYLMVERPAEDSDIENFPDPYRLYTNSQESKKTISGYPLALWPALNSAEFEMCAQRGIGTVEQLAALGKKGDQPPQIVELVARAKRMVELQKNVGQFEAQIHDLEGQVAALNETLAEARATISAQTTLIDQLKLRTAA